MDITIFKDIKQTSQPFYRNINLVIFQKDLLESASKKPAQQITTQSKDITPSQVKKSKKNTYGV